VSGKGTPATLMLAHEGVPHVVHAYTVHAADGAAGSYGQAVAAALGIEPDRMLKTLLAEMSFPDGGVRLVSAVVPVSGALDLKALATAVGGRRGAMAEPAAAAVASALRSRAPLTGTTADTSRPAPSGKLTSATSVLSIRSGSMPSAAATAWPYDPAAPSAACTV